jgi:beta-galactosidase
MFRATLRFLLFLFALTLISLAGAADPRVHQRLDDDWRFFHGDPANASVPDFDDSGWRTVTLPHDWSIEGPIGPQEPSGGSGGFFPTGIGWYRLKLEAPASWKDKQVQVEFEGVYMNASVFLNGQKLTSQPYGYTSFFANLTPALKLGQSNVLAVRVDNSLQPSSRWYSGSGIYRHVWLHVTNPVHVANWGVFVSTVRADPAAATLSVETTLRNDSAQAQTAKVETEILGPGGESLGRNESTVALPPAQEQKSSCSLTLKSPPLWSPDKAQMCTTITRLSVGDAEVDETSTPFGVRKLEWTAEKGLTLNGQTYKLKGGCVHHDNGVLGACAFDRAEERKIELLKAAGFTAIRTSHNPPSPALLAACDRLGMLVMEEAFDCWDRGKRKGDYSNYFNDWWKRDIDAMVRRDRNHPSVVMWSIGNEIPDVFADSGGKLGPELVARIHALDLSRPVTNGILGWPVKADKPTPADADRTKNANLNWNALDIVGSNYHLFQHLAVHAEHPGRVLVATESFRPSGDVEAALANPFVVGAFVWSAQDYLGESGDGRWFYQGDPTEPLIPPKPGPDGKVDPRAKGKPVNPGSDSLYPWHGAIPGELDLIGHRKSVSHRWNVAWDAGEKLYMAVRQPDDKTRPIVALGADWFPTWDSWTWPGQEGKSMTVEVYSRYSKVRLFLNDQLIGEKAPSTYYAEFTLPYQPGVLKVAGVDGDKEVESYQLATVGEPVALRLTPDRTTIHADAQDLSFVNVEVVDKDNHVQPNADQAVHFVLTGPGTIAGLGNALLKGTAPYQGTDCHVFHGRALVVLRSSHQAGTLALHAEAPGLKAATTAVLVQ